MDGEKLSYNDIGLKNDGEGVSNRHVQWVFMGTSNGVSDTESNGSTCYEDSMLSSSSSDIEEDDDATSSSTSSSNSGPLYELSELMDHLPIKRGLSNFFQGKSQSFTSLTGVKSLEDLAKKENPYKKRVKPCNKYRPKGNITKKTCSRSSRGSNFVTLLEKRGTFVGTGSCRLAVSVVQKHF